MARNQPGEVPRDEMPAAASARVSTGVHRLDDILRGGLLRGGIYTVIGPPGSGKTVLCSQMCFEQARSPGGSVVYMTLLSESHAKMLSHLRSFSYFAADLIPAKIFFVSGYAATRDGGLASLLQLVQATLRSRNPTLFIVDGLDAALGSTRGELTAPEFLHTLQAVTALVGCTTVLTATHVAGNHHPESALVDGVIELSDRLVGPRAVRELVVHKFRGSDSLRGKHEAEITSEGIVIHPRTEVQFGTPTELATEARLRMSFGVKRFDEMLGGGLLSGTTTAMLGAPGTGKSLLGLHFLVEGARNGQRGIYFGFYEPPPRLVEKAAAVGIPLGEYVRDGAIELIWQPPLEQSLDALAEHILDKVKAEPVPRRRLVIDGIEGFRSASVYPERMQRFLSAFTNQLRMQDVTTLITEELGLFPSEIDLPNPELANVVEGVVLLRYVELRSQLHRLVSIMKMRESAYDTSIREFRIGKSGIEVAESFESAEAILSGFARVRDAERRGAT